MEDNPCENEALAEDMVELIERTTLLLLPVSSSSASSSFSWLLVLRDPAPYLSIEMTINQSRPARIRNSNFCEHDGRAYRLPALSRSLSALYIIPSETKMVIGVAKPMIKWNK